MSTLNKHWDTIFSSTSDSELGWYEENTSQTLKFIESIQLKSSATAFLPGAGTSQLVDELLNRGYKLIINDISEKALNKLKQRIGINNKIIYLHHDISKPLPNEVPKVDIWIDRAVLHFLRNEAEIQTYFRNLQTSVIPGGYTLLAEFSTAGAKQCAGLELHRYSLEEMTERMGSDFELINYENYTYINPYGDPRPYIYALYKKHNSK